MKRLLSLLGLGGKSPRPLRNGDFVAVFARIEEPLMPLQRGLKYEDPLNRALLQARMGKVTGGGSVQGVDGTIEWISLDIQLVDQGPALDFLRAKLLELGAPDGTVLKFRREGSIVAVQLR